MQPTAPTANDLSAILAALPSNAREALLAEVVAAVAKDRAADELAQYRTPDGIVRFVREIIGAEPKPYQERVLRNLVIYKRVAVRAPHGAGKTTLAAWVVIWALDVFPDDVKVPTTASAWRQLIHYLWPEIRKWARKTNWLNGMPRILDMAIKSPDKEAFAVASDNPALIEGAHAKTIVYVFDEAKAIVAGTWDAAEGAFSNAGEDTDAEAFALAISTPGATSGRFYDIHQRKPGYRDWHTDHISLDECVASGQISRTWAEARKEQWGEESPVYQNRVLGEFATQDEASLIPLAWVEAANERWLECNGRGEGETAYGVDVARFGTDQTCIVRQVGRVLEEIARHALKDTMETSGIVAAKLDKTTPAGVDVIGIGAGVIDRLRELGYKGVRAINASAAALDARGKPLTDKSGELMFLNTRAAMWWLYREALDPKGEICLAIPPDDQLTGDLTAPRYGYTSNGRIQVESKDDIRKRIGRSTDDGDAAVQAHFVSPLVGGAASAERHVPVRMEIRGLYRSQRDGRHRFDKKKKDERWL